MSPMALNGMFSKELEELADTITRSLRVIYKQSLRCVPRVWTKINIMPILMTVMVENPGN